MVNKEEKISILLKINDITIPMNHFVENVFINVIQGLIKTLDKIPENKNKIEISIENNY